MIWHWLKLYQNNNVFAQTVSEERKSCNCTSRCIFPAWSCVFFRNACLYPIPELIFKCARFQSLVIMESWEINPFLDALILTNIVLDFSSKHQPFTSLSSTFGSTYLSDVFQDQKIMRKKKAQQISKYVVFSMCTCELAATSHFSHDLSLVFPQWLFLHTFNMCWVLSQKMLLFN